MANQGPSADATVVTTTNVLDRGAPILLAAHHDDDEGAWALLCGETERQKDMRIVTWADALRLDPTIAELSRLPRGWTAYRDGVGAEWVYEPDEDAEFESVPAEGYLVDLEGSGPFDHAFCGEHTIPGAECPGCARPVLRIMSLDPRDERLGLEAIGVPLVHLLFCWRCDFAQSRSAYELLADGGVRFLRSVRGGFAAELDNTVDAEGDDPFPYPDYPAAFPGCRFELQPVPNAVRATIESVRRGDIEVWDLNDVDGGHCRPRHQVGGVPYFVQGDPHALCPVCGEPMRFLASAGDETRCGRGFTGEAGVQMLFLVCVRDRVVVCYQEYG